MFSCEYSGNFKNIYFEKHLRTAATTHLNDYSWMFYALKEGNFNFSFNLLETKQF